VVKKETENETDSELWHILTNMTCNIKTPNYWHMQMSFVHV